MSIALRVFVWIILANIVAFAAFFGDKRLAEARAWRISERMLLLLALVGGSAGAIGAQHLFRHKTRKEPFRSILYGIAAVQIVALAVWLIEPDLFSPVAGALGRYLGQG